MFPRSEYVLQYHLTVAKNMLPMCLAYSENINGNVL